MDYFTILDGVDDIPSSVEGTKRNKVGKLSPTSIKSIPAFATANQIIGRWSTLPYDSMSYMVQTALHSPITWNFVDAEVTAPPFFLSDSIPSDSSVEAAAFYHVSKPTNAEVRIKRSVWNELTQNDQAGLLIHETLRQVQIGFGQGFDDQALQRVTAIYLLCQPTSRLNFYMHYVLSNSPQMADKIYGSFRTFVQTECKRMK